MARASHDPENTVGDSYAYSHIPIVAVRFVIARQLGRRVKSDLGGCTQTTATKSRLHDQADKGCRNMGLVWVSHLHFSLSRSELLWRFWAGSRSECEQKKKLFSWPRIGRPLWFNEAVRNWKLVRSTESHDSRRTQRRKRCRNETNADPSKENFWLLEGLSHDFNRNMCEPFFSCHSTTSSPDFLLKLLAPAPIS